MRRLGLCVFLVCSLAAAPMAFADTSVLAVDASTAVESTRALRIIALQALADHGLDARDAAALQAPLAPEAAREAARAAKASRLFVLHIAPLSEAVLASLEEIDIQSGDTLARATLMIDKPQDSQLCLKRLAAAVVGRKPLDEGQRVDTVAASEGRAYSKKPGEFLFGIMVDGGLGAGDFAKIPGIYGGSLRFFYEVPHANFGASIGGGGSEDAGLFQTSIMGHYLFSDGDVSPYLGGGLGVSFMGEDDHDGAWGAHLVLSGGIEAFRLHSARLVVGIEVLFPTYVLAGEERYTGGYYDEATSVWQPNPPHKSDDAYMVVPTLTVGVMF